MAEVFAPAPGRKLLRRAAPGNRPLTNESDTASDSFTAIGIGTNVIRFGWLIATARCRRSKYTMLSLEKSPKLKRTFAQSPIANIAVSTGWKAPRCGTAWTATDGRSHTSASRLSSTRVRSLGARWKVEGKAVSELQLTSRRQKDGLSTPQLCGCWKRFANLHGRLYKIDILFGT